MTPVGSASREIPFSVLGGFLGAGKTTLLNHLLRHPGDERIAVLVNDFGEVGIDADLVQARDGDTVQLTNGCICCGLATGFAEALPTLLERHPPVDRVIVEASGVADPRQVAQYGTLPGFRLDGVIGVADAERIETQVADPRIGAQVEAQLRGCDLLVLSKVDLLDDATRAGVRGWLGARFPAARLLEARNGEVAPALLLGLEAPARDLGSAPPEGHPFESRSLVLEGPLERAAVLRFVASLPRDVIRVKGILRLADAPEVRTVLHVVGSRSRLRAEGPWGEGPRESRLVLIALRGGLAGVALTTLGGAARESDR